MNPGETVVFNDVLINAGNAYDPSTGIFIAPNGGAYYFTSTILTMEPSTVVMKLYVNDAPKMFMYTSCTSVPNNSATNSLIVNLEKGDLVRIKKSESFGSRSFYIQQDWSTFTGLFLE